SRKPQAYTLVWSEACGFYIRSRSEYRFQLAQAGNGVGRLYAGSRYLRVKIYLVHAGIMRPGNIQVQRIPDHDAIRSSGGGPGNGKIKYLPVRLQAARYLGCYNVRKVMVNACVAHLQQLRFLKTVGDHVQRVLLLLQVAQHLRRIGE